MSRSSIELTQSFQQLKTNARSDADVVTWFKEHPEMLPDIPTVLAPYVKIDHVESAGFQQRFDGKPQRKLCVQYRVDKEDALNDESFEKITGVEIDCDSTRQPLISRTLFLMLSPFDWPYVMALAGKAALSLNLDGDNARNFYERVSTGWASVHPHIEWETLVALSKVDLLSLSDGDMVAWVCDRGTEHVPEILPLDIVP